MHSYHRMITRYHNRIDCTIVLTTINNLEYLEFEMSLLQPPPWEPEAYKLIDRIAADEGRFTNNNEVGKNLIL